MTTGLSGSYAINNNDLTLQPTNGKWVARTDYGVDGNARMVYATPRKFELEWELIHPVDAKQLIDFYNLVGSTGTVSVHLPEWGAVDYRFKSFSGTTLTEPEVGQYFQGYIESVKMTIMNIRT